jgi:hypothetical protein
MESAQEFEELAHQCIDWAKNAHTETERDAFLAMAKTWIQAALVARRPFPAASDLAQPA